jgi:hypothetical protein
VLTFSTGIGAVGSMVVVELVFLYVFLFLSLDMMACLPGGGVSNRLRSFFLPSDPLLSKLLGGFKSTPPAAATSSLFLLLLLFPLLFDKGRADETFFSSSFCCSAAPVASLTDLLRGDDWCFLGGDEGKTWLGVSFLILLGDVLLLDGLILPSRSSSHMAT